MDENSSPKMKVTHLKPIGNGAHGNAEVLEQSDDQRNSSSFCLF
jgi:hypothetical protein